MIIQNFTDPRVLGAACAAANRITEMSNSVYKQVVVSVLNGTYQVPRLLYLTLSTVIMFLYRWLMGLNMIL